MTDRYRTVCACGRPECPYRTPAPNTHRKEPIVKNRHWAWYVLLVLTVAACIVHAVADTTWSAWTFWTLWGAYAAWLLYEYFPRRPTCSNHWRTADDRRPAQPCDCPRCSF